MRFCAVEILHFQRNKSKRVYLISSNVKKIDIRWYLVLVKFGWTLHYTLHFYSVCCQSMICGLEIIFLISLLSKLTRYDVITVCFNVRDTSLKLWCSTLFNFIL
jgi:hypothetical protein